MPKAKNPRDKSYGAPPRWDRLYARHCPHDTDPYSRHVRLVADNLRGLHSPFRNLVEDGGYEADHIASSMEVTVKELWKARARIRELEEIIAEPDI